jgi:hypothetical protein
MLIFGAILGGNKMAIKGFLDKLTGKAQREEEARLAAEAVAEKQRKAEERKAKKEAKKAEAEAKKNDTKARATAAGEPWVEVLSIEVDPTDPGNGAFELDWNDIFVARLIKSGYQGKTDQDIVDNWFRAVCRNVVLETFEQDQADPEKRAVSNRRDLGNGRTEVS